MRSKLRQFVIIISVIIVVSGCKSKIETGANDAELNSGLEKNEIVYTDEKQKIISYESLSFSKANYHISKIVKESDKTTFYYDLNADSSKKIEKNLFFTIQKCKELIIDDYDSAKEYLGTTMNCTEFKYYQDIESDNDIQTIYMANNQETTDYLIKLYNEDGVYYITSNDSHLDYTLIDGAPENFLLYKCTVTEISDENSQGQQLQINYFYPEKRATYEWTGNKLVKESEEIIMPEE